MDDQGISREAGGIRYRKLRIAWSVACGILCLLLIALWIRSYWIADALRGPQMTFASLFGRVAVSHFPLQEDGTPKFNTNWEHETLPVEDQVRKPGVRRLVFRRELGHISLTIPYWLAAFTVVILATLPWLPCRFSIRRLLIGTAILSAVLGLLVWLDF
jgi:hypothetical protein